MMTICSDVRVAPDGGVFVNRRARVEEESIFGVVCTESLIRVDEVKVSPKLTECRASIFPSRDFDLAIQVEDLDRGRECVAPAREIEASMPANARSRGYAPCRHHVDGHRGGGWVLKAAFVTARGAEVHQHQRIIR
jgi:hypothetical protein